MGVVKKQTIQNSVIQYIGIALGYFNSVILFTNILDTEQYGLTRVLVAISTLYVSFSSLGAPKILIRFFPYFKSEDKKHRGFLFFNASLCLIGFIVTSSIYLLFSDFVVKHYSDTSPLFIDNYTYVILLSFFMLYANIMENYMIARKSTVLPYFMKSIFIRLVWIIEIVLYHYRYYDFDTFIFLYVSAYFLNFLFLFIHEIRAGELKFSFEFFKFRKRVVKVLVNYGFYNIVTGISTLMTNRIDIIMITFMIGLTSTSVYSIAFYISSVIMVPSTSIYRIAMPVLSEQWKNKNLTDMLSLYRKSSITLLLSGTFVFLCIWMNIDDLFGYFRPEYRAGKYVVFILSLSILFNMSMGINNEIITITKYFRYDTYASVALGLLTIGTNFIFIPIYGIEGAAIATLISVVTYHTYKVILIYVKLKMFPFTIKSLLALLAAFLTFGIIHFLPDFTDIVLIRIFIRCAIIALLYLLAIRFFKLSPDISGEIKRYTSRLKLRKSS